MKRLFQALNAGVFGFLTTLVIAALSVMILMFSTRGAGVRAVGLFGSVFFEATERPDGSMWLSVGVQDWVVLALLWLAFSLLAWLAIHFYGQLKAYRQRLLDVEQR